MKFFSKLSEIYNRNVLTKIIYWILIGIFCVTIAYVYEIGFLKYKQNHVKDINKYIKGITYTALIEEPDGYLQTTASNATMHITLTEPIYIDKLDLEIKAKDNGPVRYEITSDSKYISNETTFYPEVFYNEVDIANVNATVSNIDITFTNVYNRAFKVKVTNTSLSPQINFYRALIIAVCCFLGAITLTFITKIAKFKLQNLFLFYSIPICLLVSFFVPPHYTWDEYAHLTRAVYVSQGILNVEDTTVAQFPYNYDYLDTTNYRSAEDFHRFIEQFENPDGDNLIKEPRHISTSANTYLFIPYISAAIGIKIAQIFHLNAYYYVVFSRLANGFLYILLAYFGLKYFVGNKLVIFFLSLLPIIFYVNCSSGLNAIIIGTIILTIGFITYYRKTKKPISYWIYLLLLVLIALSTIARMTYGFLFFLLFLLPRKQFKNKFIGILNYIIVPFIAAGLMYYVYYYSNHIGEFTSFKAFPGAEPDKQLALIFHNPFLYLLRVWVLSEKIFSFYIVSELINAPYLGSISGIYTLICGITIFLVTLGQNPDDLSYTDWYSRILILIIFILCYGATVTSMYVTLTSYNSGAIIGMQLRYVFPFLFLLLPCIESKNFYLHIKENYLENIAVVVSCILSIAFIGLLLSKFYT